MAGVAAVALGLFIYLQQSSPKLYLLGRIHGFDSVTYQSLDISCQRNSILGRLVVKPTNPKRADYDFVIFKQQIHSNIVTVSLPWKDRLEERELRVRTSDFAWAFGDYQRLEWELSEEGRGPESILTLFDLNKGKTIACEGEMIIGTSATAWNLHSIKVINYAFAKGRVSYQCNAYFGNAEGARYADSARCPRRTISSTSRSDPSHHEHTAPGNFKLSREIGSLCGLGADASFRQDQSGDNLV